MDRGGRGSESSEVITSSAAEALPEAAPTTFAKG